MKGFESEVCVPTYGRLSYVSRSTTYILCESLEVYREKVSLDYRAFNVIETRGSGTQCFRHASDRSLKMNKYICALLPLTNSCCRNASKPRQKAAIFCTDYIDLSEITFPQAFTG